MKIRPLASALLLTATLAATAEAADIIEYRGVCDASAAVALDESHFVVGNDEDNDLRVYRLGKAEAVARIPLNDFARPERKHPEMDIEAAATIGKRIYWITSHGANGKTKHRASRHRLFATDMRNGGPVPTLTPVGRAYEGLLDDMRTRPGARPYRLEDAARIAPKEAGGLNIEGLAATPQGTLLIGFRNPVTRGKLWWSGLPAAAVITGTRGKIGRVTELDLAILFARWIQRPMATASSRVRPAAAGRSVSMPGAAA